MSISSIQSNIKRLQDEIATLRSKVATSRKRQAEAMLKSSKAQEAASKSKSASTIKSKISEAQRADTDAAKYMKEVADNEKRIAEKEKRLNTERQNLLKAQADEDKKKQRTQQKVYDGYERQIKSLKQQIEDMDVDTTPVPQYTHPFVENNDVQYDVFISHASEDKESFVNELYKELTALGLKVWYDQAVLKWGDPLRSKIDEGLRNSRFGIVVISRDYIQKGWTQYELEGLFNKEMTVGKTILPIWHNISKSEVLRFSPTLGGKLALMTSVLTTQEIAEKFKELIDGTSNG